MTRQVKNYPAVLQEVARVLRPGGLFLSYEWGRYPAFLPELSLNPLEHVPGVCHFFDVLTRALDDCRGIRLQAIDVPIFIRSSGRFTDISIRQFYMPVGPWQEGSEMKALGRAFRASLSRYADSVKPLLQEAGFTEREVTEIVHGYIHELKTVRGMVCILHTVHARKL